MYGWDVVAAYWRGEITLRKLRVLISALPPGGPTYRAVHGHGWTEHHYLLADVIDAAANTTTAVYRAAAGGKRVRNPRRYPRPGKDSGYARVGDRGTRGSAEVVTYLHSLKGG